MMRRAQTEARGEAELVDQRDVLQVLVEIVRRRRLVGDRGAHSFRLDGVEGLANLKAETPDLMILDLLMPKMDGFHVLKELQDPRWSKFKHIPVLVLTSVREEASRRRYELETGLELGVDDYVEKPMLPEILIERVGKLIKKKGRA